MEATGTFDVQMSPLESDFSMSAPAQFAHLRLTKTFQGDLTGTSEGQMMSVRHETEGGAGYVALEQVKAELSGRTGTFVLQHSGVMSAACAELVVQIVPDSGTGGLAGIQGNLSIDIKEGQHFYTLNYNLPD